MSNVNQSETTPPTSTTVHDPVCGMTVDPAQARGRAQHKGESYYFCSPGCMHKFVSDPGRYLSASYKADGMSTEAPTQMGATCKIERDPVCGMSVDPAKAASSVEHDRKLYHFCCKGCAEKFKADPQKYLSPAYKPGGMGASTRRHHRRRDARHRPPAAAASIPIGTLARTEGCDVRLPHVSRGARVEARALSQVRHGARA